MHASMFLKKLFGRAEPASKPLPLPRGSAFSARVATFWEWFAAHAETLDGMMTVERQSELVALMNDAVVVLSPTVLDWCFQHGANGAKHSFVLTSAGNPHRRQLIEYWLQQAPEIPGWSFFAAKQPVPKPEEFQMMVEGTSFHASEIWVSPELDENVQRFKIWLWHPAFASLPQQSCTIASIMLDGMLGEDMVAALIGGVATKNDRLQTAMPLTELREFILAEVTRREWQNRIGAQRMIRARLPQIPAPPYDFEEFVTSLPDLITEMVSGELVERDPLEQSGAAYYFMRMLHGGSIGDQMKAFRDAMDDRLAESGSGRRIGFGVGPEACLYFIIAFNPGAVLALLTDLMAQQQVPRGSGVYPCSQVYGVGPVVPPGW